MGDKDKLFGAKRNKYPKLTDESSEEEPGTSREIPSKTNSENKVLGGSFSKPNTSRNNTEGPNIPVKSGPPESNKTLQKRKTTVPDFEYLRGMNGVRALQKMNKVLLGFIPKNFMEIPKNPVKSQSQSTCSVPSPLFNYTFTEYKHPLSFDINSIELPGTSTQQASDEDDCIIVDEIPAKEISCPVQPKKRDLNVEKSATRSSPSFCASSPRCEIAREELRRVPSSSESEYSEPAHCPMLCTSSCIPHHRKMPKSRGVRKMGKKLMKDKSRRKRVSYKTLRRRSKGHAKKKKQGEPGSSSSSRRRSKGHAKKKKQGEPGSSSSSSSSSGFSDSSTSSSCHSSPGPASRRRLFSASSSPSSSPDRHRHQYIFKNIGLLPKHRSRSPLTKSRNSSNQPTKVPAETLSTNKDHLHDIFVPFGVIKNIEKPLERSNSFTTRGLAHIEYDNTSDVGIAVKHMDNSPADVHKMVVAPVLPLKCRTVTNRWSPERCASLISLNNPTKSCICEHAHMLNFAAREVVQKSIPFTIPAPNASLVPNRI